LSPLILIGIIGVIIYFAANSDSTTQDVNLAVISVDPSIAQMLEQSDETLSIVSDIETEEEAREELENQEIDGYLVVDWEENQLNASITHDGLGDQLPMIEQVLTSTQTLMRASELNLTPEQ